MKGRTIDLYTIWFKILKSFYQRRHIEQNVGQNHQYIIIIKKKWDFKCIYMQKKDN